MDRRILLTFDRITRIQLPEEPLKGHVCKFERSKTMDEHRSPIRSLKTRVQLSTGQRELGPKISALPSRRTSRPKPSNKRSVIENWISVNFRTILKGFFSRDFWRFAIFLGVPHYSTTSDNAAPSNNPLFKRLVKFICRYNVQ